VPRVLLQPRESGATLAWILLFVFLPFLGLLAFLLFGNTRLRLRRRRRRRIEARLAPARGPLIEQADSAADEVFGEQLDLLRLARRLDAPGPRPGNAVRLYRDGPAAFDAIEAAILAARDHLHLTYYIWKADRTGARLRDALAAAAARGVEVRLLIDDVGSSFTPRRFFAPIAAAGGRVARFLPLNPLSRQLVLNNRNHRKTVVVDGRVGFTGGMNVGDEYAGLKGPWRDAHVRVEGPAVLALQEVFCQDWYHATGQDLARPRYFPPCAAAGPAWVQFLASGPADRRWRSIHSLLFAAVNLAQDRVWIETPYFVPDAPMAMALQTAALRGVDVRLLMPGTSDHPLVLYAGRSFYGDLLAAGVRIYELPLAMLHAKTATVDGRFATVGSTNMDQRSFRLNFEANAFFFGGTMARDLERSFAAMQAEAVEVTHRRFVRRGVVRRLGEGMARTLSPLL
jgi:cardiolipin synthase